MAPLSEYDHQLITLYQERHQLLADEQKKGIFRTLISAQGKCGCLHNGNKDYLINTHSTQQVVVTVAEFRQTSRNFSHRCFQVTMPPLSKKLLGCTELNDFPITVMKRFVVEEVKGEQTGI